MQKSIQWDCKLQPHSSARDCSVHGWKTLKGFGQAEEAAAEITRKLEKQEKKRLKKEKILAWEIPWTGAW